MVNNLQPKIIFLLQDVPALYGAERVTLALMSGLRNRGLNVRVILIGESRLGSGPAAMDQAIDAAGIPSERIEVAGRFSWFLVRAVRQRLKENPGAILHTLGYKAHLHGLLAARGGVARTVTTIHGWLVRPEWKERFYEWLEIRLLRRDDAVICLSSYYETLLIQCGVRRERLHRIATGLAADQIPVETQACAWPDAPFTVAVVGRFSWEKNHSLFLRALARVRQVGLDVRAVLAGDGSEKSSIEIQVSDLGLSDAVRLVGYVPIADLLPAVHAVCLCSHIENLPLSLMEAMVWQRPVVATRVGGIPDIVEDGVTGRLIADDDEVALADVLTNWAKNPAHAQSLGQAGRIRALTQFSFDRSIVRHEQLYGILASS